MPTKKRIGTIYPGVYYILSAFIRDGKQEQTYYVRYRKNGVLFEEKVGGQFLDKMTPKKAAKIRSDCIEGKRPPKRELREKRQSKMKSMSGQEQTERSYPVPGQTPSSAYNTFKYSGEKIIPDEKNEKLNLDEEALWKSKEIYQIIFENANDLILFTNVQGYIIHVNKKLEEIYGYRKSDFIGKHYTEIGARVFSQRSQKKMLADYENAIAAGTIRDILYFEVLRKDGAIAFVETNAVFLENDGKIIAVIVIIRDITKRKLAEKKLRKAYDELERKVQERTVNLEEMNAALKVLLQKREEDKTALEEKIMFNIEKLVMPTLERLKTSRLNKRKKTLLNIMETNLNEVVKEFAPGVSLNTLKLTPTEIQVANFIKQNKSTKEITDILNISESSVIFHRHNIRKKFGLIHQKVNLQSYLKTVN